MWERALVTSRSGSATAVSSASSRHRGRRASTHVLAIGTASTAPRHPRLGIRRRSRRRDIARAETRRQGVNEVRHLLRAPARRVRGTTAREQPADPGRARPGRARRPARHPVRVGGRAPLPRGVLHSSAPEVFLAAVQPAHQEHPPRPRHHPDRAAATTTRPAPPSGSRMLDLVSNGRVEFGIGRVVERGRARRLRHRPDRRSASSGSRASRSRSAA